MYETHRGSHATEVNICRKHARVVLLDGNVYIMPLHYSLVLNGDPNSHMKIPQPRQVSFANQLQKAYRFPEKQKLHTLFHISLKLRSGPEAQEGKAHRSYDRSGYLAISSQSRNELECLILKQT